jgi:outer membrane protein
MLFCKKICMKSGLLVLNVILLAAVGVLFYLHFSGGKKAAPAIVQSNKTEKPSGSSKDFRIAYFELDSITNSFQMVKDVKSELSREEEDMNGQMDRLQKSYNDMIAQYQKQSKDNGMSQVESEQANRNVLQMQDRLRGKKQELDQKYQDLYMRKMQDVKTKIEEFLKEYNQSKGYSYILAYEPGFIYYRDSVFNITDDLIKGLNDRYKKK